MDNCNDSKIKLMNDLLAVSQYLGTYASVHSDNAGHPACSSLYDEMKQDIDGHIGKLKEAVTGLSREGKF